MGLAGCGPSEHNHRTRPGIANKPVFMDRDSVVKYKLSEIGIERRTGYKWLGYWPKNFVTREYPEWKAKLAKPTAEVP